MFSGSGLGLSIVAMLARGHGGQVGYDGGPEGACFLITLPAAPPPIRTGPAVAPAASARTP